MRAMHLNLRKDHHLKHQGRLQYDVFFSVFSPKETISLKRLELNPSRDHRESHTGSVYVERSNREHRVFYFEVSL